VKAMKRSWGDEGADCVMGGAAGVGQDLGKRRVWLILATVLLLFTVAACGRGKPEATPTPTKTPMLETGQQTDPASPATPEPQNPGDTTTPTATPVPADNSTSAPEPTTKVMATINASILNVRSGPTTESDVVQTVNQGERYEIIGRNQEDTWVQLGTDGRELGWVATEFVTVETVQVAEGGSDTGGGQAAAEPPAQEPAASQPPASTGDGSYLPATMSSPDFGGQAFLWWRGEIADRDLTLMKEAGFNWVKQTFAWETIEGRGKGQFDWTIADRVVSHVDSHGLKVLARLSTDPDLQNFWAGAPPQNADNFADFAFAVASRYNCGPGSVGCIQAYQVWNEPNLGREWGGNRPNPAEYSEFLRKAYKRDQTWQPQCHCHQRRHGADGRQQQYRDA